MSLKDKLLAGQASNQSLNGDQPNIVDQQLSKLHDEYSLNGDPYIPNKPAPTSLGNISQRRYLNNLPN